MRKLLVVAALAAALGFTLFQSYELKRPCLEKPWGEPLRLEYRNLCYNDVQALYGVRKLDQRAFPYIEDKSYEYPVLMGITMWATSLFAHGHVEYFNATVPLLSLMAVLALVGLVGALGLRRELLWFAAGTPLLFYAYLNWDLLPVAFVCLAMWAWARGRLAATGAAIGLGVAAKIYPAFLLPSLMIAVWKQREKDRRVRDLSILLGSAAGAWLAVNVPVIIAEFMKTGAIDGWLSVFAFHARRSPDFGTIWYWFYQLASNDVPSFMALLPPLFMGGITIWLATRTRLAAKRVPVAFAGAFATTMLMVVVRSVQHGMSPDDFRFLVDHVSETAFGAGALGLWFYQWKSRQGPWTTGGAVLAIYLIVSKIHSPQHALWILPLMIAVNVPSRTLVAYLVSDALVFVGGFLWFATSPAMQLNFWEGVFIAGVFARAVSLGKFAMDCFTRASDRFVLLEAPSQAHVPKSKRELRAA